MIIYRYLIFLLGLFSLALGVCCLINAGLGTATWDVLHIGLALHTPLSIGAWIQILGFAMIVVTCLLEKSLPKIGTLLNTFIVGFFIDLILQMQIVPTFNSLFQNILLFLVGIVLMGNGSGMYVATNIGAGPRDGLTLVLAKKLNRSIRLVRTVLEGTALLIGALIGGPVAWGTFASVFMIGPILQAALSFWRKQLEKLEKKQIVSKKAAS
mgnify:CR=1 FL=1